MGGEVDRHRVLTPRERRREAFYTAVIAFVIVAVMLGSTVGSIDAYDEPAPAVAEAIHDARVAARDAQLPEPWPPR